jgi:lysophospholipase L1-like esterase
MKQKKQSGDSSLTSMQKHAIAVCAICAVAVLATASVTSVLVLDRVYQTPSSQPSASSEELSTSGSALANYYKIDSSLDALLPLTEDAGDEYLNDTLFLGDSNTVRFYNNGLLSLQQYCAREGLSLQSAISEEFVAFKKDDARYTLAQAVAKLKPRRVVITLGTNDTSEDVETFIRNYKTLIQQIQESYPYTDIIVNTVPPIPENHSDYADMTQEKIDDFNMALAELCSQMNVKFLNSAEALKDKTGYGNSEYYVSGDIHLKSNGLKVLLNYVRTHAYTTEDRRPDTKNIPTLAPEYSNTPSAAVTPTPTEEPTATEEPEEDIEYQAYYQVDRGTGGTLSCGNESGKYSLSYTVTSSEQTLTVTAVPSNGYVFVKWSDGVTTMTRTDANFKQNINVTAVFSAASVTIKGNTSATPGKAYSIKASLSGQYATADRLHWYVNGAEVAEAAGQTNVSFTVERTLENQTYEISAAIIYNESTVTSNTIKVSVGAAPQEPTPDPTPDETEEPAASNSIVSSASSSTSASSAATSAEPAAASDSDNESRSEIGEPAKTLHEAVTEEESTASVLSAEE